MSAVSATTARQNYSLLQAKSLSRAGAKMLPKGVSYRAKTGPIVGTGFCGRPSGPSCFALSQNYVWTGGAGHSAGLRRQDNDNDNDMVTIRL